MRQLFRRQAHGDGGWNEAMRLDTLSTAAADPLAKQLDHFCDVIEGRSPSKVTVDDAARSLSVTLAAVKAVQTGGTVRPLDVRDNKVEAKSQTRLGATKRTLKAVQIDGSDMDALEAPERP